MNCFMLPYALLLALLIRFTVPANAAEPGEPSPAPPNIVLILADDLGYGDVSCYGATEIETPNLDRLAATGVRFTRGYCTSATCTPSRYGLLTGRYPWKNERAHILPGDAPLIIDPAGPTLPKLLSRAGYHTAAIGKWHLGMGNGKVDWNGEVAPGANSCGFDESYLLAATQDRVPTVLIKNQRVAGLDPADPIEVSYKENFPGEPTGRDNPELLKMGLTHGHDMSIHNGISRIGYQRGGVAARWVDEDLADVFTNQAKAYLNRRKDKPFFLYFALHQPHVPRTPHARFVGKSGMGPRGDAIVEADWCVGQLLDELERLGLRENTLIVFGSDNGPVLDDGYADNAAEQLGNHTPAGPLRGGKYSLFDAGARTPFLVSWPAEVTPGVSDALVCQVDLLASFAKLTGQSTPDGVDSLDTLDALLGKSPLGRKELILEARGRTCLRTLDWAYLPPGRGPAVIKTVNIESGVLDAPQLYNLNDDVGQQRNAAADQPAILAELQARYRKAMGQFHKQSE